MPSDENGRERLEDLHKTIGACDKVLRSVEASLAGFQRDLGEVSTEIETLQNRSTALNTRLENRKVVEKLLGPAVEDVSISPTVVRTIAVGPINEEWVKALAELERRIKIIDGKLKEETPAKAALDVKPLLNDLVNRVIERIRDHLVSQVKAMRSPSINAQIIQQNNLAKYRDTFGFLVRHQPKLGEEITQAYVNTMRWYYHDHFTRYRAALEKLKVIPMDKSDAIGSDPSISRAAKPGGARTSNLYDIGRRGDILNTHNHSAISSYLAEEDKGVHHFEVPFRNFGIALVDNVSAEYSFLTAFFNKMSLGQLSGRCAEIFTPTFNLGKEMLNSLLEVNTLDCLGILLCVRLNQAFAFELQRRRIPVMDNHINATSIALWPKFQTAMDAHTESVKTLAATISARSAASKLSFTGTSTDASKQSMAPHFLTQRFGQFLYGILSISKDAGDDEPVGRSLSRLRTEYEGFLIKTSKSVAGSDTKRRERFLANNYILVETIISDTEGKMAEDVKCWLAELKSSAGRQK